MNATRQHHNEIADLLLPFCEAASISHREPANALKKRIVVSLVSFIDNQALHKRLFGPQAHLEWHHVQTYLADVSPATQDWMQLLSLLDFVEEPPVRDLVLDIMRQASAGPTALLGAPCMPLVRQQHQPVSPLESMRICMSKAHVAHPLSWDAICKALLVCNISDLDATSALGSLLSSSPPSRLVTDILSHLSTFRHTPEEYENDILYILDSSRCRVREHLVLQSVERAEARASALRQSAQSAFSANKRPSLTKILQNLRVSGPGSEGGSEDNLTSFCKTARLSPNSNRRIKLIVYFLACLPDSVSERKSMMERVLGCNAALANVVAGIAVVTPDIAALRDAVMGTKHAGAACDDLRRFREACVSASMINGSCLMWTAVLQLYLASYCRPSVAKDLLGYITSHYAGCGNGDASWLRAGASSEVEGRLNTFARQCPMALSTIVELMLES